MMQISGKLQYSMSIFCFDVPIQAVLILIDKENKKLMVLLAGAQIFWQVDVAAKQ
jgi:hypothetical protein